MRINDMLMFCQGIIINVRGKGRPFRIEKISEEG